MSEFLFLRWVGAVLTSAASILFAMPQFVHAADPADVIDSLAQQGQPAVPILRNALLDKNPRVRCRAACALVTLARNGVSTQDAVPELRKVLFDTVPATRAFAAEALLAMGEKASDALPELARAAADKDPAVRMPAVAALGRLGTAYEVPVLEKALADDDLNVRHSAVTGLGRIGTAAKNAAPKLHEVVFHDKFDQNRREAAKALVKVDRTAAQQLTAELVGVMNDRRNRRDERLLAAECLREMGPEAKSAIEDLRRAALGSDALLARRAIDAIGAMGRAAKDSMPDLVRLSRSTDSDIAVAAKSAIRDVGGSHGP